MSWCQVVQLLRDLAYVLLWVVIFWRAVTSLPKMSIFSSSAGSQREREIDYVANLKLFKLSDDGLNHLQYRVALEQLRRRKAAEPCHSHGGAGVAVAHGCHRRASRGKRHPWPSTTGRKPETNNEDH
ncbi:hypothetical protein ABEF93_001584 [Exophiala dermatitidis]